MRNARERETFEYMSTYIFWVINNSWSSFNIKIRSCNVLLDLYRNPFSSDVREPNLVFVSPKACNLQLFPSLEPIQSYFPTMWLQLPSLSTSSRFVMPIWSARIIPLLSYELDPSLLYLLSLLQSPIFQISLNCTIITVKLEETCKRKLPFN